MQTEAQISNLAHEMHQAAAEAGYSAERFGKDSPEHLSLIKAYCLAADTYEKACAKAGRPAYATYSED